ncbi:hypothetical protein ACHQM5_010284 [Ranunculus cassubicifolius]
MPKKRKVDQYSDPDSDSNQEDEEIEEGEKVENDDNENEIELSQDDLKKIIEGFTKEQIVELVLKAASTDPKLVESIHELADSDPSQRKLFVHGLGWETTSETLREFYSQYGELEECNVVTDKISGKSKGYGFLCFKHRRSAQKALKEPQKKIESRLTACQLASAGPVYGPTYQYQQQLSNLRDNLSQESTLARKIYVGNVDKDITSDRLYEFFSKYGEIEEGPLGFDKHTGKSRGYALFIYKTIEGARKALEEHHKIIDGTLLYCQKATDCNKQKAESASNAQTMPGNVPGGSGGFGFPGIMAYNQPGFVGNPAMYGQGIMGGGVAPIHAALTVLAAAGQNPAAFGVPPPQMGPFNPSMFAGYGMAPTYPPPPGNQRPGARPSGGR